MLNYKIMKKQCILSLLSFFMLSSAIALPPRTPPKEFPTTIPKHEIGKSVASIKTFPVITAYLNGNWKGDIIWTTAEGGFSAVIRDIYFFLPLSRLNYSGQVNWDLSLQQVVTAQQGSYSLVADKISFSFNYAPYSYSFSGEYNKYSGKITGTFSLTRAAYPNPPAYYKEGSISGTFILTKK